LNRFDNFVSFNKAVNKDRLLLGVSAQQWRGNGRGYRCSA